MLEHMTVSEIEAQIQKFEQNVSVRSYDIGSTLKTLYRMKYKAEKGAESTNGNSN